VSNALIAGPVDTATPFSGAGLLDSGTQLVAAIESGNWVEGGLAAFGAVADTVAAVMDPLGSLIAAGLGWLIDHFEPIKGWFNDLTGDAGAVAGFAQTWTNVQNQLDASADYLERVITDLDDMAGEAIEAYRRFQTDAAAHIRASASWAGAMSTGLQIASTIVQVVHDLVRDILSQLVGSAISWATQAVVTVGIATPWIIAQVSSRVASWTAKISSKLTGLLRSCGKLGDLLTELRALMSKGAGLLGSVPRRAPRGDGPRVDASARTPRPDSQNAAPGVSADAPGGAALSASELDNLSKAGFHSTIFGPEVADFYLAPNPHLGRQGGLVWAMPIEDAAKIHTLDDAARETGRAPMAAAAARDGTDLYALHFPVDPAELRRPTVADSGGHPHFYEDPLNPDPTYGHTAVREGGVVRVNETRETILDGGKPVRPGAVLTQLLGGDWVVVKRIP